MVRLAHLLTGVPAVAEEIAQEAFVGLLNTTHVTSPEAYVRRSVANLAMNSSKRAVTEHRHRQRLRAPEPAVQSDTDELWPLVCRLPPRQRAVVVLRYYLDMSELEIARTLGCRPGTVKAHSAKALTRLRQEMPSS